MRQTLRALVLVTALAAGSAHAQGRGEEQPTPLRFEPGNACVDYRGNASLFTLRLEAGTKIAASATGVAIGAPGQPRWLDMREVSISPWYPAGDLVPLDKASEATIPATGVYGIGLSPESQAGNPGELLICKVGPG